MRKLGIEQREDFLGTWSFWGPEFVTSVSRDLIIGFQVLGFESVREGQARERERKSDV